MSNNEPIAWANPKDLEQDGYSHSFYVHQVQPGNINCVPLYTTPQPCPQNATCVACAEKDELLIEIDRQLEDVHYLGSYAEGIRVLAKRCVEKDARIKELEEQRDKYWQTAKNLQIEKEMLRVDPHWPNIKFKEDGK